MNIKVDSRKVKKGDTFVAIKGYTVDGHDYIENAILNGASRIICESGSYCVETIVVENSNNWLCEYLKFNYAEKINKLNLIGVTGTNGKTTTCFLTYSALKKLNKRSAYIGTMGFYMSDFVESLPNTTPEILELYNILLTCLENNIEYVVVELSSHALSLNRAYGLKFDVGLFTNLTQDHLDYHLTMEAYALAKQKLFENIKENGNAIVNIDSLYNEYMLLPKNNNVTFGKKKSDFNIVNYIYNVDNTSFDFAFENKRYNVITPLLGDYNVYNVLSSIIILKCLGFSFIEVCPLFRNLHAPEGRMETYSYKGSTIIIDFAHSPDAVENIIDTIKRVSKGKIYVVLGSQGDSDKLKRPIMGKISTEKADYSIFTTDNPKTEKPEDIINDMVKDLKTTNYEIIIDREEAIKKAFSLLKENDYLLLLGKGHETYQIVGHEKVPFCEKEIIKKLIENS